MNKDLQKPKEPTAGWKHKLNNIVAFSGKEISTINSDDKRKIYLFYGDVENLISNLLKEERINVFKEIWNKTVQEIKDL